MTYYIICTCAYPCPIGWPHWQPVGSYQCRCGGWKSVAWR